MRNILGQDLDIDIVSVIAAFRIPYLYFSREIESPFLSEMARS